MTTDYGWGFIETSLCKSLLNDKRSGIPGHWQGLAQNYLERMEALYRWLLYDNGR